MLQGLFPFCGLAGLFNIFPSGAALFSAGHSFSCQDQIFNSSVTEGDDISTHRKTGKGPEFRGRKGIKPRDGPRSRTVWFHCSMDDGSPKSFIRCRNNGADGIGLFWVNRYW
jgi:hypothetical protein